MRNTLRRGLVAAFLPIAVCGVDFGRTDLAIASAVTAVAVDTAAAARAISEYRATRGLPPVRVEPRLSKIAAVHSQKMAALDRLDHVLPGEGSFRQRVEGGGYAAAVASENIGAGYDTLSAAIAAWKASPGHNENLLRPDVTEIGIALYRTPQGAYRTYWTLILASPRPPQAAAKVLPDSGFFGTFPWFGQ